jgi:hypothetical protein
MDGESENSDIESLLELGGVRVKYLDAEDIQELGWVYRGKHWIYKFDDYFEFNINENTSYFLHIDNTITRHNLANYINIPDDIINRLYIRIFRGSPEYRYGYNDGPGRVADIEIKNYNELDFIMKRANIKKEENE